MVLDSWGLPLRTKRAILEIDGMLSEAERPAFYAGLRAGDYPEVGVRGISIPMRVRKNQVHAILTDPSSLASFWLLPDGRIAMMASSAQAHGTWWRTARYPEAHERRIRRHATDVSSGAAG